MGKASSAKKVSRAARTGGGRTKRGSSSYLFPSAMALVAILGTLLIVQSRGSLKADTTPPRPPEDGRPYDHWHSAIGFDICGTFAPPIQSNEDPLGIHTHGDGVIHTHPFLNRSAGKNAKLGIYLDTVGARVTRTEIRLPGQDTKKAGQECDGRAAQVQVKVWQSRAADDQGTIYRGDPDDLRLGNNQLITVAFLPEGADIPKPPSEGALDRLTDLGTDPNALPPIDPNALPPIDPTATTLPADPTASTVAGDPTATTLPADPAATTVTTSPAANPSPESP